MPYTYEYPRPSLTVDCVIFGLGDDGLKVLLIKRAGDPFKGRWALPGGFVDMDEDLETAARRELQEETGLTKVYMEQLYTFGTPGRDPRGRVVSVAYWALTRELAEPVRADSDADAAGWHGVGDGMGGLPPLAFDHDVILKMAYARLRAKVRYQPIGFELLPQAFTLSQLQKLYETILDKVLDKRNFRKRVLEMEILKEAGVEKDVPRKAAKLYRFDKRRYDLLARDGFNFEL